MSLIRWEPFQEFDDLLRRFAPLTGRAGPRPGTAEWAPVANISETAQEYLIKAELPEVRKEDVRVTLDNGVLTISGERKLEKEHKEENDIRVESFYGNFSRSFSLPDNVDITGIHAESKDGVLRVHLPKTAMSQSRSIAIDVK